MSFRPRSLRSSISRCALLSALLAAPQAQATITLLAPNANLDLDNDASSDDLRGVLSGSVTAIRHINGSRRFSSSDDNWNTIDVCDVQGAPSTSDFIPDVDGEEILIIETGTNRFHKLRRPVGGTNGPAGIQIEHVFLSATPCTPPVASFTWIAHDLIVDFLGTSTGSPFSFAWTFGDGGGSALQHPRHVYGSTNSWNVCLTVTGTGGTSAPSCQLVSVAQVPSILLPPNGTIDFDGDGSSDLRVLASAACLPASNLFRPLNGAEHSALAQDFDLVDYGDAASALYAQGDFCHEAQEFDDTLLVRTGVGSLVKAWTPQNDVAGVRIQFELLELGIFSDGFESGSTGAWSSTQGLVWKGAAEALVVAASRLRLVGNENTPAVVVRYIRSSGIVEVAVESDGEEFLGEFPLSHSPSSRTRRLELRIFAPPSTVPEGSRLAAYLEIGDDFRLDLTSELGLELRVRDGFRISGDEVEVRPLVTPSEDEVDGVGRAVPGGHE